MDKTSAVDIITYVDLIGVLLIGVEEGVGKRRHQEGLTHRAGLVVNKCRAAKNAVV